MVGGGGASFWLLHVQTAPVLKLCDVVFDLCVWSFTSTAAVFLLSSPSTSFSSLFQLYHVIWMNLHRDSPIWRRRGFRKCLKMTQQQQAYSCLQELHWDKVDFSAVQFWSLSLIED